MRKVLGTENLSLFSNFQVFSYKPQFPCLELEHSHLKLEVSHLELKHSHLELEVSRLELKHSHLELEVSHL
ncbi:hypothetical protein I8751_09640 [Nostocaceae cyanobacterium CENA357]|uniref:Uncharacterized protein n=1 Tax=Atlanticothrix silvestris CENA357 TaxID=1725252 RepID=A0A8J7HHT0_9CYAN|nr:hypothetical protein [Atlanticothrix silvestris]MBH8552633.1 hypothetical protein [Atlanticothrix silvestris CENA357]